MPESSRPNACRRPFGTAALTCLLLAPAVCPPAHAESPEQTTAPAHRIPLEPSRLALLAATLKDADAAERSDFAGIVLRTLRDSYAHELTRSLEDAARSARRRRELVRWQAATQTLLDTLDLALQRLADGTGFNVRVDRRYQVLVQIGDLTIAVSGPNPTADRQLEQQVIAAYCTRYDCRALATRDDPPPSASRHRRGHWDLRQGRRPAFAIGDRLRCEFADVARRPAKAEVCHRLREELDLLHDALRGAAARGFRIDWDGIASRGPPAEPDAALVVNARGAFLQLHLPLSARLDPRDWLRLVQWLRAPVDSGRVLVVARGDGLLDALPPD